MQIDRHNYEEYFILYMDNELSPGERRMVEAFAAKHPDLQEELESLLQYKLEPDTSITFSGKDELMKVNGDTPVTAGNYEEWLVLYTDNELNATQRTAVEQYIAANPAAQQELALMMQTRLQPDTTLVFPDKSVLYRREEKVRPLLPRWWRMAAAAILLIAAGLTTVFIINNGNKTGTGTVPVAKNTDAGSNKPVPAPVVPQSPQANNDPAAVATVNNTPVTPGNIKLRGAEKKDLVPAVAVQNNNQGIQKNNIPGPEKMNPANNPVPEKNNKTDIADNRPVSPNNNLPTPEQNPYYNNNKKKDDAIVNTPVPDEIKNMTTPLTNPVVTTGNRQPSDNTEPSFEENGKKNKLRGFFRKVARTFEKRTSIDATDGNDRLLVAGLSFKMK